MTEERASYTGENDMPVPTIMFERLKRVAQAEANKIILENWQGRPPDVEPLLRALLAELRKPNEEMRNRAHDARTANGSPWSKGFDDTWQAGIDAILAEAGQNAKSEG